MLISARLETSLNQQDRVPDNNNYQIPLSVAGKTVKGLPGVTDLAKGAIVIPRVANVSLLAEIALTNAAAGSRYIAGIQIVRPGGGTFYRGQVSGPYANGAVQFNVTVNWDGQPGDIATPYTYLVGGGANLTGQYNGSQSSLTLTELSVA